MSKKSPKAGGARNPVVGLVQMTCSEKPEKNLKKAIERIDDAARKGATVVCLQELFRSQYFCQSEDIKLFSLAEEIPGPSTAAIAGPRDYSDQGVETPGALFNCVIPSPGPGGFRLGPCWLDYVGRDAH